MGDFFVAEMKMKCFKRLHIPEIIDPNTGLTGTVAQLRNKFGGLEICMASKMRQHLSDH